MEPFAEDDDNYSIDLENKAIREKQAHSEVLNRLAEFCQLERANAEAKKEIIGMQRPIYNASKKTAIKLVLPWHNLTVKIAQRNHEIVSGRLSKSMKSLNTAKPWGRKDFLRAQAIILIMARATSLGRNH